MTTPDLMLGRVVGVRFAGSVARARCAHCGLDVPAGLVEDGADAQFCCSGCRTAFAVITAGGLSHYYTIAEPAGAPARASGRRYEEFDHPSFEELYVRRDASGLAHADLYLEGVHCAACVWLIERVPHLAPGVAGAELELGRSLARVTWDPAQTTLGALARALDTLGYRAHPFRGVRADAMRRREDRALLARIGVAGAIAANVMLVAIAMYAGWFGGISREDERFFRWTSLILTTPTLWPAAVFFRGALAALRARTLNMDVPIAIGLAAGFIRGAINTVTDTGPVYFDAVATLTFLLLVGRFLQQRGQRAAANSAELLYSLAPATARVIGDDGVSTDVPTQGVLPATLVEVRVGDVVPADGIVESGESAMNASLLTGESRPVPAAPGDTVYAGTTNLSAPLRVRVSAAGEATRLAGIVRAVEEGSARRAPVVLLANRVAAWFVGVILVLAAATFAAWMLIDPSRAADNAIALLVVTCPCALALATPLAVSTAIGRAAREDVLVKGGDALEQLARPAELLLDKTGTVTEARLVLEHWSGTEWAKALVLALEAGSTHPIARAFRDAWPEVTASIPSETTHTIGGGIEGVVDGFRVALGSPAFVRQVALQSPTLPVMPPEGLTPVLVAVDGHVVAAAGFGDPIRAGTREALDALRDAGWRVRLLSGDDTGVVRSVGARLGFAAEDCIGAASPEEKLRVVREAASRGRVVMVGDGVNDAAAIAAATVGVGVHGGAEASLATAGVYLARPGLAPLVRLAGGARRTLGVIRRNIAFALAYNVVGVTLAVTGVLDPLIAALLMPAASLTVVIASWRSRTFTGDPA